MLNGWVTDESWPRARESGVKGVRYIGIFNGIGQCWSFFDQSSMMWCHLIPQTLDQTDIPHDRLWFANVFNGCLLYGHIELNVIFHNITLAQCMTFSKRLEQNFKFHFTVVFNLSLPVGLSWGLSCPPCWSFPSSRHSRRSFTLFFFCSEHFLHSVCKVDSL